ncbi:MAG: ferritin-like domain-containing protein [Candidatus Anammoxibacter sp.]
MKFDIIGEEIKIYDFNALQALKIGRRLEIEGIDFYNNALISGDVVDAVKDGLEFLIQEEKKHLTLLEDKIEEITAQEEDGFEEEDLEDFLNTKVFSDINNLKDKNEGFNNLQETIAFGLKIENRSIMFYKALLGHIDDKSGRAVVEELVSQESDHLQKLNTLMNSINKQ